MKTVLMFSGGLDSTALLHYLLNHTDDEIIVHHIDYSQDAEFTNRNRLKLNLISAAQEISVPRMLDYWKKNSRPFIFETTTIQLSPEFTQSGPFFCATIGAFAVWKHQATHFVTGHTPGNLTDEDFMFKKSFHERIFDILMEHGTGKVIEYRDSAKDEPRVTYALKKYHNPMNVVWSTPLVDLRWNKPQSIKHLPYDLRKLVVTCDFPTVHEDDWTRCNKCSRCVSFERNDGLRKD